MTIAPALMNGLRGMPFSVSSWISELNRMPEGSLPTLFHSSSGTHSIASARAKSLEIDWIEKGVSASPVANSFPSTVLTTSANWRGFNVMIHLEFLIENFLHMLLSAVVRGLTRDIYEA